MLIRYVFRHAAYVMLLCTIVAIMPSGSVNAQSFSPRNASDKDLLMIYGAFVRANYRNRSSIGTDSPEFLAIEEELELRRLVDRTAYKEIERGLIYLNMPFSQLYAVVDGLEEVELVSLAPHDLQVFKSSPVPDSRFGGRQNVRQTFFACNEKLIGYVVSGLTTFETYYSGSATESKAQTNFENGFLEPNSTYMRRWLERGRIWKSRQSVSAGALGHGYYILNIHGAGNTLKKLLDSNIEKGKFPELKGYFDKVC